MSSRRQPPRYELPKAAPEPLRRVQVLVNTTDGHERELLPEWLVGEGVRPTPAALAAARGAREALRELLLANNEGRRPSTSALEVLDRAAERSRLTVRFAVGGELVPLAEGVHGALGRVLASAFAAIEDGSWGRLKACRNCHWVFYDYSRNRSASWCSMQLCGNRLKTKAYRRRSRAARAPGRAAGPAGPASHPGGGLPPSTRV